MKHIITYLIGGVVTLLMIAIVATLFAIFSPKMTSDELKDNNALFT